MQPTRRFGVLFLTFCCAVVVASCANVSGPGANGSGSGGKTGGGTGNKDGGVFEARPPAEAGMTGDPKKCGNGQIDQYEDCDDGNQEFGDGCTKQCKMEADYDCPVVGMLCKNTAKCGDGKLASSESC